MDLSLRGSQINLAKREKIKPKHLYQKNVQFSNLRPRSASYQFKRSNTSPTPFLHRPQSADPKFERAGFSSIFQGNCYDIKRNGLNQKRYKSISSSSLLKLLLEEPISRSCCYRDDSVTNRSTSELQFESKSTHPLRKATSLEVSSVDEDNSEKYSNTIGSRKKTNWNMSHISSASAAAALDRPQSSKSVKPQAENWLSEKQLKKNLSLSNIYANEKTDLPGRVSFFKSDMNNDIDYSDSENDKNEYYTTFTTSEPAKQECISAPGPLIYNMPKDFGTKTASNSKEIISPNSKKSVHFGCSGNESVLAETYVYSNMTSENCSGSTRSSSSTSLQDSLDLKCTCCGHKNAETSTDLLMKSTEENNKTMTKSFTNHEVNQTNATNDVKTASEYDTKQYVAKQNNLSEKVLEPTSNANSHCIVTELLKAENNLDRKVNNEECLNNSSNSVIKNYLEVAASAAIMCKKESYQSKTSNGITIAAKKISYCKSKTAGSDLVPRHKKAPSFLTSREQSNLAEFRLDDVESWMAAQDSNKQLIENKNNEKIYKNENNMNLTVEDNNDTTSQTSTKSDDQSQDDFTYDDIVSVIKEIDEDKKKDNLAERVVNEMEIKLNSNSCEQKDSPKDTEEKPDKYKNILTYLDEIEDSCDKTLLETRRSLPESNRTEIEFVVEPDIIEDVPKLSDLVLMPNHQLARRVVALSLRANELANAVHLSKEHVARIRSEKQKIIRAEKANLTTRLKDQKKHYEDIVQRHQGFIEQLLKDKGSLCDKIAALTRRLESQNNAWEHKMETEITRMKETILAGEKIKRERWVRENTKKIKELTVKGLEAEINKMNASHQEELAGLKRMHQQQLLTALEEARHRHEEVENSVRQTCAQDREMILEKERTAIRERFERQLQQERKSFDEQKEKLYAEIASERERLEQELKAKDVDFQAKRQEIQREKQLEMEQAIAELHDKMSRQDEKYQNRINTIEKQFEADFQIWKRDYENECKLVHTEKENIIRQHYRAERDRQIDEIVKRMDAEALKNAEEHELKISRLKQKYEIDLQELEKAEKLLHEKYVETRNKLAESDAQVRNFEAEIKQLHIELEHAKKMCNDALAERDQLRDNMRNEVQNEVAALKYERDSDIEKIHKRVQQAIEKKDATIDMLQKENNVLRERCLKLEAVIRQQRKDYCAK